MTDNPWPIPDSEHLTNMKKIVGKMLNRHIDTPEQARRTLAAIQKFSESTLLDLSLEIEQIVLMLGCHVVYAAVQKRAEEFEKMALPAPQP